MHQKSLKFEIIQDFRFHELSEWEYIGRGWDVDGMVNLEQSAQLRPLRPGAILDG